MIISMNNKEIIQQYHHCNYHDTNDDISRG